MKSEYAIQTKLNAALADYRSRANGLAPDDAVALKATIKGLKADLQSVLTEGAENCPSCDRHPIGIRQPWGLEVGCTGNTCHNRRAKGATRGEAVSNWNEAAYFKGTVR